MPSPEYTSFGIAVTYRYDHDLYDLHEPSTFCLAGRAKPNGAAPIDAGCCTGWSSICPCCLSRRGFSLHRGRCQQCSTNSTTPMPVRVRNVFRRMAGRAATPREWEAARPGGLPNLGRLLLGFDGILPDDLDGFVAQRIEILEGLRIAVCNRLVEAIEFGDAHMLGRITYERNYLSVGGTQIATASLL